MGEENHADHLAAIRDPETVHAMLEDYRAGLGVDRAAQEADRAAGRRVGCPTLVLWSARDDLEELHGDPRAIWAGWTTDLRGGGPTDSGHHMAQEAPDELVSALVGVPADVIIAVPPGRGRATTREERSCRRPRRAAAPSCPSCPAR